MSKFTDSRRSGLKDSLYVPDDTILKTEYSSQNSVSIMVMDVSYDSQFFTLKSRFRTWYQALCLLCIQIQCFEILSSDSEAHSLLLIVLQWSASCLDSDDMMLHFSINLSISLSCLEVHTLFSMLRLPFPLIHLNGIIWRPINQIIAHFILDITAFLLFSI